MESHVEVVNKNGRTKYCTMYSGRDILNTYEERDEGKGTENLQNTEVF